MQKVNHLKFRKGARRKRDVPVDVLRYLATGELETVNLMEWLAADMSALARNVAATTSYQPLRRALLNAAGEMLGKGVKERIAVAGRAIASTLGDIRHPAFLGLACHQSDLVRQWACSAVNEECLSRSLDKRLIATTVFAKDSNMSVREVAWMAFRPHVRSDLENSIQSLEPLSRDSDPNLRRFAIEVTRPRSVWGAHINQLKDEPATAFALLNNVRSDPARYVQLAVGNWLNDASKTRPDWVYKICQSWTKFENHHTDAIVKRGLRTLKSRGEHDSLLTSISSTSISTQTC